MIQQSCRDKLLAHISSLAPSLHTLDLMLSSPDPSSPSPIFELDLPFLRSLSLASFSEVDAAQAMAFFERHPSIEYLNIASNFPGTNNCWFAPELPPNFLPNLRHLRVSGNLHSLYNDSIILPIGALERRSTPRSYPRPTAQSFYQRKRQCTNTLPSPIRSSEWTAEPQEFGCRPKGVFERQEQKY